MTMRYQYSSCLWNSPVERFPGASFTDNDVEIFPSQWPHMNEEPRPIMPAGSYTRGVDAWRTCGDAKRAARLFRHFVIGVLYDRQGWDGEVVVSTASSTIIGSAQMHIAPRCFSEIVQDQ